MIKNPLLKAERGRSLSPCENKVYKNKYRPARKFKSDQKCYWEF
jgi:hypothetical protein